MKTAMACGLALALVATVTGARADSPDCCKGAGAGTSGCTAAGCKICVDANGMTVAALAKQLSEKIGVEVRVQGPGFETLKLKLCAATPEAALSQVAATLHGQWHPAYIFGSGSPAPNPAAAERAVTVTFRGAAAGSAAYLTAAQTGGVLIADRPLTGKVTFQGKHVPAGMVLDAIAVASGVNWRPAYVLQFGPETLVARHGDHSHTGSGAGNLQERPGSPLTHLHRAPGGMSGIAPAPGMIVKDPEAELARLVKESMRRQELGEWANVFTQESPRDVRRAIRDLRIRVETTIQKLESYPVQDREAASGMWRARYERMLEDYKHLSPDQQKQVQPVLDAMKYFEAPSN
jgi:hypothetical protein